MAINQDNVMVTGADNGSLHFFDWESGYNFQRIQSPLQPGSLSSEAAILPIKFNFGNQKPSVFSIAQCGEIKIKTLIKMIRSPYWIGKIMGLKKRPLQRNECLINEKHLPLVLRE